MGSWLRRKKGEECVVPMVFLLPFCQTLTLFHFVPIPASASSVMFLHHFKSIEKLCGVARGPGKLCYTKWNKGITYNYPDFLALKLFCISVYVVVI